MTPLLAAALELQEFLIERQWRFCIIGGVALLRWGEPRLTRGVDVSLLAGYGGEDRRIPGADSQRRRVRAQKPCRQRGRLDWAYIETQLTPLAELKGEDEILRLFRKLRTS